MPALPLSTPGDRTSLTAVVAAMGIVFGDIATSPLYTLQECLTGPHGVAPVPANVLGCISLIVWSLLLVVTLKYVGVLMRADNRGEGGILALLALVPRDRRERAPGVLGTTTVLVLIGAALLFGDGIITPAISVLSAVEGLRIAAPGLDALIVPLTVAILAALFSIQHRGSGGLGRYFGPVMALWLVTALILGIVHIARRPEVLTALSPFDARLPGVGVVMTATATSIPPVLLNMVRRFRALHRTVLLTTVTTEETPHVRSDRISIDVLGKGVYRVLLRYGFMDEPHVHQALTTIVSDIEDGAQPSALTYVLGQERVIPGAGGRMGRVAEVIFAALSRNAANPSDFYELPPAQVVEIGARVDL